MSSRVRTKQWPAPFVALLFVLVVLAAISGWQKPMPAFAVFGEQTSTDGVFSAATLLSPASLSAVPSGTSLNCIVTLNWSPPSTSFAPTNWVIQRYNGSIASGGPVTLSGGATSYVDSASLSKTITYTWAIHAVSGTWTSVPTMSAGERINPNCN